MSNQPIDRRAFLAATSGAAVTSTLPLGKVWAQPAATVSPAVTAESLVKTLYDTLSPGQREAICFAWDHRDPRRGLLRTRVANNWHVTPHSVGDDFFTADQRAIVRGVMKNLYSPEWIDRVDRQLGDDGGGWHQRKTLTGRSAKNNVNIAIANR
ncbi:MAG: hypothetical protein AAF266_12295 [Planctomycetota bacterium]